MLIRARFRQIFGAAVVIVGLGGVPLFGLQLHGERALPTDLAVTGRLAGVPAGETRFVRWADLRALPAITKLKLDGEFVKGEQEVTALWLADFWAALPIRFWRPAPTAMRPITGRNSSRPTVRFSF